MLGQLLQNASADLRAFAEKIDTIHTTVEGLRDIRGTLQKRIEEIDKLIGVVEAAVPQAAKPAATQKFKGLSIKEAVIAILAEGPMNFTDLRAKLIAEGVGKDNAEFSRSLTGTMNGLTRHGTIYRGKTGIMELTAKARRFVQRAVATHDKNGAVYA